MRKWLILFVFATATAQAEMGAGDNLAHPPTVILTEQWLYNRTVPVYQVTVEHAGEYAVLRAAETTVASLYPGFKNFNSEFIQSLHHYIIDRQDQGTRTTIWIRRNIIADWLITS